ncbi:MAG: DUF692 domain-containing protein [Betaproteobacteria bacterium]|nr:DUF692 domain-containing protein [Betaproteobacteria bacterium]
MNNHPIDPRRAGIGLRPAHYAAWLAAPPRVSFLEVHSENFFGDGGQPLAYLEHFRADYAISTHGVGLSLGSASGLDARHLAKLKRLVDRIEPVIVSEHLCWVGVNGRFANDLLPLPYTEEALDVVVANVQHVQDTLKRRILVENVSSYLEFAASTIPEHEFVRAVAERSGAQILLDINNVHVNVVNHGLDARAYLAAIPGERVGEIHLAGFEEAGGVLIDTHGAPVCEDVWALYGETIARIGPKPTLIEWDTDLPAPEVLLGEAARANDVLNTRTNAHAA